jgi:PAS domain-containing protein
MPKNLGNKIQIIITNIMNNEEQDNDSDAKLLRESAEEQLKLNQKKSGTFDTEPDVARLLHELQVHQIELEMQNEQLRQSYEETESALKKYTMMYDLAPIGFYTLDKSGNILELNFKGAELLGERRFSLVNTNFKLFVSDESKPIFNEFFNKVFSKIHKESCQVQLGYNNTPLSKVFMEGVVIGRDMNCLLSVFDISTIEARF